MASDTSDRELLITRLLNAPREKVFQVWTDPNHIAQWWGPKGFTTTIHEMDVRPGGLWRYIMHGPDGVDYGNRIAYTEVVPPERLVYWHGEDEDDDPNRFHVTVRFEDQGGKTNLSMRLILASASALEEAKKYGAVEGGNSTMDCLEEYLAVF